jgi:hypothetical protein
VTLGLEIQVVLKLTSFRSYKNLSVFLVQNRFLNLRLKDSSNSIQKIHCFSRFSSNSVNDLFIFACFPQTQSFQTTPSHSNLHNKSTQTPPTTSFTPPQISSTFPTKSWSEFPLPKRFDLFHFPPTSSPLNHLSQQNLQLNFVRNNVEMPSTFASSGNWMKNSMFI